MDTPACHYAMCIVLFTPSSELGNHSTIHQISSQYTRTFNMLLYNDLQTTGALRQAFEERRENLVYLLTYSVTYSIRQSHFTFARNSLVTWNATRGINKGMYRQLGVSNRCFCNVMQQTVFI